MEVLRITAEGLTTSFRYPHFLFGSQPSYPMPPPATIYGHLCSALGAWVDPARVAFAYQFTHAGRFQDLEHVHLLRRSRGKLPDTRLPKVMEGQVNPFQREQLLLPRLTLYLNRPEWAAAFRSPRYPVLLGRSQDLFTYLEVRCLTLQRAERAYLEHTLLPHAMAPQVMRGLAITMPRYLDYEQGRAPRFAAYLMLEERIFLPPEPGEGLRLAMPYGPYWVDPTSPTVRGAQRAVIWHTFVDEADAAPLP